jgi:hypothetical protein
MTGQMNSDEISPCEISLPSSASHHALFKARCRSIDPGLSWVSSGFGMENFDFEMTSTDEEAQKGRNIKNLNPLTA